MTNPSPPARSRILRLMPIAAWLPLCTAASLRADFMAGLALAALLIPEGMAYAGIAGVPPQAGLFAVASGLFVYALFGTSRQLAVSPTSGSAAMLAALVGPMAMGDATRYSVLAAATAIAAGVLLLIGGLFKLGFVSEFISKPVLKGFVFGIAVTIMVRQLPKILGIEKGHGDFFDQVWHLATSLGQTNAWTLATGAAALAITFGLGAVAPRVPSALVVFVGGIVMSVQLGLHEHGVEIVGAMQGGLPRFAFPMLARADWPELLSGAVGIVLILYAEALAAGRTFAAKNKYDISPNQEFTALGFANLTSGCMQGFVVGGGMSGTAANASGGARTQVSAIVTSMLTLVTLAYLMPLFHYLPEAVLGAIVIHAVAHLADFAELRRFARLRTGSVYAALAALGGVLAFGILKGLVLAVCLTLIALMKKLSAPQESVLGRLPATGSFVDVRRYPEAELIPGVLIFRPDGLVFFANANRVFNHLKELIAGSAEPLKAVVLNLEAVPETDVTTIDIFEQFRADLAATGTRLCLARVADPVRDLLEDQRVRANGWAQANMFRGVDTAVEACEKGV